MSDIMRRLAKLELQARKRGKAQPVVIFVSIDENDEIPEGAVVIDIGSPNVYPITQQDQEQEGEEPDTNLTFPS